MIFVMLTYLLAYSMEQSPTSEANRFSASQEIPYILWNAKFITTFTIATCPYPEPHESSPWPYIPLPEDLS